MFMRRKVSSGRLVLQRRLLLVFLNIVLLVSQYPSTRLREARSDVARYIVQEGNLQPLEYTDRNTKEAVLPALGYWQYQIPTLRQEEGSPVTFPETIQFLGLTMKRIKLGCQGR